MSIQTTPPTQVEACPAFWGDWKDITKHHRGTQFDTSFSPEDLKTLAAEARIDSYPLLSAVKQTVLSSIQQGNVDSQAVPYDRQIPQLLAAGWVIRKMRWAISNKGKSHGLRVIFLQNREFIIFVFVATKNTCSDERRLEATFLPRIREYFDL